METFWLSFTNCFEPYMLLVTFLGVAGGIVIGAIPGLTPPMAIAIMTSFTFGMDSIAAISLMIGVYFGGVYGGGIGSILLNIPGTPGAIMSGLDGHPMAQRGEAGKAIGIATWSSFVGGLFGMIVLIIMAPLLSSVAIRFSAPENFALAIFGLSIICTLCTDYSLAKGIVSVCVGLIVCTIGLDPVTGVDRYTFGVAELTSGVEFIPVMIGLFGLTEILSQVSLHNVKPISQNISQVLPSFSLMKRLLPTQLRASIIGTFVGALPGAGATIAAFLAYNYESRTNKRRSEFGQGVPEGLAAPQAADNSCCGGAFIPMMTLGIPGDAVTAILIGTFVLHNITPGPMLFTEHPEVVYSVYITGIIADIFLVVTGLLAARFFSRLLTIPYYLLFPIILLMCLMGPFAVSNTISGTYIVLVFGVMGFIMRKLSLPILPMVLGVVLGPIMEVNLRMAILMSAGQVSFWLERPIFLVIMLLSLILILWPIISKRFMKNRAEAVSE